MFIHTFAMILGSLVINLLQCLVHYSPLSSKRKLKINQYLAGWFWDAMYGILRISNVNIQLSGSTLPTKKENTIILSNHQTNLDFLATMPVVLQMGFSCGNTIMLMKNVVKYVPLFGWTSYFQGGMPLNRSWKQDQKKLTRLYNRLNDPYEHPYPYLFGMYPEGTRHTLSRMIQAQNFEKSRGLPVLHHVLCPRTKGFVSLIQRTRKTCKYVVDLTIAYDPVPLQTFELFSKLRFNTRRINIHVDLFDITQLPTEEPELERWLYKQYEKKDQLIANWKRTRFFPYSRTFSLPNSSVWLYPFIGFHIFFAGVVGLLFGKWATLIVLGLSVVF